MSRDQTVSGHRLWDLIEARDARIIDLETKLANLQAQLEAERESHRLTVDEGLSPW